MGGYLVNFSIYTFAMIGFLFLAVVIYKKSSSTFINKKTGGMVIEDSLSLSSRKRLHVVKVNGEKFLIAADTERTEFLAKLEAKETPFEKDNIIQLNKNSGLLSSDKKITKINTKLDERLNKTLITRGNNAIEIKEKGHQITRLNQIKNINLKKPPMMREILRKLEI